MSYRSRDDERRAAHEAAQRASRSTGYTLVHAGRQMRIGPLTFWIVVGTLVIMAGWSLLTGSYFAFREDVLTRLIARQAHMQIAYEDRIAELRAQVDRLTSRQLLDQEHFEQKLDAILRRQATLEQRASSLTGVPDPAPTGSIKPPTRSIAPSEPAGTLKPSPINDTVIFVAPPEREARLESRPLPGASRITAKVASAGLEGMLARLQDSLDRVETRQVATLNSLEESYDAKAKRMRSLLSDLGLGIGKMQPAAGAGTGGPFVPVTLKSDAGAFERQLFRINLARSQVDRLTRTLLAVPIRKPVFGTMETTSGFGVRNDPFLRSPAMHTGLDLRGSTGDPVRATAGGTVTSTGWNGGYGRMVEIDHGNGISTRYAHLSSAEVKEGQVVRAGHIIGRVGSTGRSTGPHLHYETRIDGEAVDPQKFLRAGLRLGSALGQ
jgi:murein DD-endopeptidase MepM/ murein hydrolase activator NlpD